MLKFEALAKVGDTIKAFDFRPMSDRPDCYVVGKVIAKGNIPFSRETMTGGFDAYTIAVTEDTMHKAINGRFERYHKRLQKGRYPKKGLMGTHGTVPNYWGHLELSTI